MPPRRYLLVAILVSLLANGLISCTTDSALVSVSTQSGFAQIDIMGPESGENDPVNPFTNYRLNVIFSNGDFELKVPGYFAADGNSASNSSETGNVWRVRFTPPEYGIWHYVIQFEKSQNIVDQYFSGEVEALLAHGIEGDVNIDKPSESEISFRMRGKLNKAGHYLQESKSGQYFLKMGANSPENLLAFKDFDGTFYTGSKEQRTGESAPNQGLHLYEPHVSDWKEGDPAWKDGKGKGLIGALNYLASKGMNSVYFLTMNIKGDGEDVFPYVGPDDLTRFDCSKLDQWDIVFSHAESLGIILHVVTQETENETLMDNGNVGSIRNLYYRELVARFGYHNNIIWNMGEENGPAEFSPNGQTPQQRLAMADWFVQNDPFRHPVFIHSHSWPAAKDETLGPLLGVFGYDGISMQVDRKETVNSEFQKWRELSALSDAPWILSMDEIGMYYDGAKPDEFDPGHDSLRIDVLWGSLLAGSAGVEWYFGYKFPNDDLKCEDWRSRDNLWEQTYHAGKFFEENIPWWEMEPAPGLIDQNAGFCLAKEGEVYLYLLRPAQIATLNLKQISGEFEITKYDPKTGEHFGEPSKTSGRETIEITPPDNHSGDYVVLIKKLN